MWPVRAWSGGDALLALVAGGRVVADANDLETVRELAARGPGVALMSRSVVASHRERLAIRPLSPRKVVPEARASEARSDGDGRSPPGESS